MASFYMKSKAIVWFQKMKEACVIKSWDIFVMALQFFGTLTYDNPIENLINLK